MRPTDMHLLSHRGCHHCAPKAWRDVPVMTGDYDFDATILHRSNGDLPLRLNLYLKHDVKAYGPVTGYSGYNNYHGDD
jgi:hypothetical protein